MSLTIEHKTPEDVTEEERQQITRLKSAYAKEVVGSKEEREHPLQMDIVITKNENGEVVGYAEYMKTKHPARGLNIHLHECYIDPGYRRQGLLQNMYNEIEDHAVAQGARSITASAGTIEGLKTLKKQGGLARLELKSHAEIEKLKAAGKGPFSWFRAALWKKRVRR